MRIVIGGDLCPDGRSADLLSTGDSDAVFSDLLEEFRSADLLIANLECPLIEAPSPIKKVGPVIGAPRGTIAGIRNAGFDVLGLANNHILDHGATGLDTTLAACRENGIATVGAGANLGQARQVHWCEAGDNRIAIIAVAEHEFSLATENSPGANPLDLIQLVGTLREIREAARLTIVLLHGGNEHYPYPSPRLSGLCHFLVEEGAGIVVCQHSHRSGCLERHREGHIVYGQGNLVFDRHPHSEDSWYEGFLLIIDVNDRDTEIRLSPYRQFDSEPKVRRLDGRMHSSFLARIEERNRKVLDDDFLRQEWERFCEAERDTYLGYLRGHSRWTRQLSKRLPLLRHVYSEPRRRLMRSVIQCESHREVLETLLGANQPAEAIQ